MKHATSHVICGAAAEPVHYQHQRQLFTLYNYQLPELLHYILDAVMDSSFYAVSLDPGL